MKPKKNTFATQLANIKIIINIFMGVFMICMGFILLFRKYLKIDLGILENYFSDNYIFVAYAILCIFYGIWRIYKQIQTLKYKNLILLIIGTISIYSCNDKTTATTPKETLTSGTITIYADESFKPVLEAQKEVFEATYPEAHINISYKSEVDCEKALFDTINPPKMIVISKPLTLDQQKWIKKRNGAYPRIEAMARDGIALIVHKNSNLEQLSMKEVQALISEKGFENYYPLLDGKNKTSNLRFLDSINNHQPFNPKIKGVESTQEVINFISNNNTPAIGFIGVSWISNARKDPTQAEILKNIKVLKVECTSCDKQPYYTPTQADIGTKRYPLNRLIYTIMNDQSGNSLASGFTNFLFLERGQLIFRHAGIMPYHFLYTIRKVQIAE